MRDSCVTFRTAGLPSRRGSSSVPISPFRALTAVLAAAVLSAPVLAAAQDTVPPPGESAPHPAAAAAGRPRIGLALGGGSARGLAHIGVLEWFEAHRIPIDYIA